MGHQGELDLGQMFGLRQQSWAQLSDPLICSSGSVGFSISTMEDRFPNYVQFLRALPWAFSDPEILGLTYFTCAYNEAALRSEGGFGGTGWQGRCNIRIPAGSWFVNSELRGGQHRNIGAGKQWNFGSGGSQIQLLDTNWKSIHGPQNDGLKILGHCWNYAGENNLTPQPFAIGGGYEYSHFFTWEHCHLKGTAGYNSFFSPLNREVGIMLHNAGEGTKVENCWGSEFRTFAVLVGRYTARPRVSQCNLFNNSVAAIGQRGGALSEIIYDDISGDNNPYMLFMYQSGSNVFGQGPFMPMSDAHVPGGLITFRNVKTEAFACRSGYAGMSSCNPNFIGKGGMWAHLTGRFWFTADSCALNVHEGKLWTAIEVSDQNDMATVFPSGGYEGSIGLDNSTVHIHNPKFTNVHNWMADWKRGRAHTFPQPFGDYNRMNFRWDNLNDNGQAWAETPTGKQIWTTTPNSHRGTQPFINQNQTLLNWGTGAPNFNYHPVTGVNY